jgi:hypothetical protein
MRFAVVILIVALAVAGCGGSNGVSGNAGGTSGTSGGGNGGSAAPALVQWNTSQTTNTAGENNTMVQFKSLTAKGHTIWVVVTVPDYGGIHTETSITDTQGNIYTKLDQQNDGAPGSQSVAHFYAANIVGDTTAADTITVNWGYDNYKGVLVTEISGTTAAPLVGHDSAIQDDLPAGGNNVTSGPITVAPAQTPALLVAVSVNTSGGTSDTGGSTFPGPAAGSGMTAAGSFWNWGANVGTFVTAAVDDAESISPVFNAPDTDSYVTVAAVFH